MRAALRQRLGSVVPALSGGRDRDESDGGEEQNEENGGRELDGTADGGTDADRERRADRAFRERTDERPDASPATDAPRHVVCVVVDALRADAVDPEVAPFLDDVVDVAAISPSTWTFPAVTSLLSGRYPHDHGAMRDADGFEDSVASVTPLPDPADGALLPDVLAGAGYATYGAFGFLVPFLAAEGHFSTHALYDDASAGRVLADHVEWLADHRHGPTFSYLHLADLHEPVDPPAGYWDAHDVDSDVPGVTGWRHEDVVESTPTVERYRDHRRRLYRATVEHVDNRLAAHRRRVADVVGAVPGYVVTADHGEGFWERAEVHAGHFADPRPAYCVGHGGAPYEPVVRVPLGVSGLGVEIPGGRRTSLVDVAPTLAEVVGVGRPTDVDAGEADVGGADGGEAEWGMADVDGTGGGEADGHGVDGGGTDAASAGIPLSETVPDDRRVLVEGARYGYEKRAVYGDGHKLLASRGDDVTLALSLPAEEPVDLPGPVEASLLAAIPPWPEEGGDASEGGAGRSGRGVAGGRESPAGGDRSVAPDVEERLERIGYR